MYRVYINDRFFFGTGDYAMPLYDIVDPVLIRGKNAIDSFAFTMYPGHPLFDSVEKLVSYVEIKKNEKVRFRGRVLA
ncbi:MAG: hypothetical protein ACI4Q5_01230, partial [Porcipelethomonas sp.]